MDSHPALYGPTGYGLHDGEAAASDLGIGSRPHNGLNYRALRERLRLRSDEYLMSTVVFAGTAPNSGD